MRTHWTQHYSICNLTPCVTTVWMRSIYHINMHLLWINLRCANDYSIGTINGKAKKANVQSCWPIYLLRFGLQSDRAQVSVTTNCNDDYHVTDTYCCKQNRGCGSRLFAFCSLCTLHLHISHKYEHLLLYAFVMPVTPQVQSQSWHYNNESIRERENMSMLQYVYTVHTVSIISILIPCSRLQFFRWWSNFPKHGLPNEQSKMLLCGFGNRLINKMELILKKKRQGHTQVG